MHTLHLARYSHLKGLPIVVLLGHSAMAGSGNVAQVSSEHSFSEGLSISTGHMAGARCTFRGHILFLCFSTQTIKFRRLRFVTAEQRASILLIVPNLLQMGFPLHTHRCKSLCSTTPCTVRNLVARMKIISNLNRPSIALYCMT